MKTVIKKFEFQVGYRLGNKREIVEVDTRMNSTISYFSNVLDNWNK